MLLDITHEEVETHTHGIIHLEYHVEVQDAKLDERAETITNLEPADPVEIDGMLDIDED
jgi:hypothetical protein